MQNGVIDLLHQGDDLSAICSESADSDNFSTDISPSDPVTEDTDIPWQGFISLKFQAWLDACEHLSSVVNHNREKKFLQF